MKALSSTQLLKNIVIWGGLFVSSSPTLLLAQYAGSGLGQNYDSLQDDFDDRLEEGSPEDDDQELEVIEKPMKHSSEKMLLSAGRQHALTLASLSYITPIAPERELSWTLGHGFNKVFSDFNSIEYSSKFHSYLAALGYRWYPFTYLPLFLQFDWGLGLFSGFTEKRSDYENESVQLNTLKFQAWGSTLDVSIGIQHFFDDAWGLEFVLMGMGKSWLLSSDFEQEQPSSDDEANIKRALSIPYAYGLMNVSLSYRF